MRSTFPHRVPAIIGACAIAASAALVVAELVETVAVVVASVAGSVVVAVVDNNLDSVRHNQSWVNSAAEAAAPVEAPDSSNAA